MRLVGLHRFKVRMHDQVRVLAASARGRELPHEVHQPIVEIDPDVRPALCDDGRRATARTDASVTIWDVRWVGTRVDFLMSLLWPRMSTPMCMHVYVLWMNWWMGGEGGWRTRH